MAGFLLLQWIAPATLVDLAELMRRTFQELPTGDLTGEQLTPLAFTSLTVLAKTAVPMMIGLMLCGVAASFLQTGFSLSLQPLRPDFQRLNPLQGLSRLFSTRVWFDLVKTIAKTGACGIVLYQVGTDRMNDLLLLGRTDRMVALGTISSVAVEMGMKVGGLLVVLAFLDYGYQRMQHERGLRMTRQEVRDEMRSAEGDPNLKAHIRGEQRALAKHRMMQAVPQADVIVTNPTHLAIALRYAPRAMGAPRVVAKGERLTAQRIISLAKEHKVPIVRNIPLAHALFRTVEIGDEIPASLYKAVAEVLAFVYRLREERRVHLVG